ncbi:DUF4360 domain-containing protein [Actinoplanes sp. M2I2]|uniref:DUF4360 domain-containing protein n=1 Tax=Actinoplanes sp. M2I2 TaxID=1734444 RepID=UPI0020202E53|nr:DUF4360 domain-containing protein [Actinoplanes sp. M2I2]
MLKTLVTGATMIAALAATGAAASAAPAPPATDKMLIDVVAANGSGCPKDSADVTVSPDNKAFTVTYSEFTAQVGGGAKSTDFRKNCQLALNVDVPQGFTYAIASTDYRGFAHLERGASGTETASYYFQGERRTTKIRHDFTGPMDGDWQRTDKVGISSLSFLPCGEERYLNVNTELRVSAGWSDKKKTSFLTMDSTDGNLDTVYHVAWKKC